MAQVERWQKQVGVKGMNSQSDTDTGSENPSLLSAVGGETCKSADDESKGAGSGSVASEKKAADCDGGRILTWADVVTQGQDHVAEADRSKARTTSADCEENMCNDPPVVSSKDLEGLSEARKKEIQNAIVKAAYLYDSLNPQQAHNLHKSVQIWKFLWQDDGKKGISPRAIEHAVKDKIQGNRGRTMPACWYYQRGYCRKGAKCNFGHDDHG